MIHFIRHAESHFNAAIQNLKGELGSSFKASKQHFDTKFNMQYLNVEINNKGRQQAAKAKQEMKDIKVELVLVSPMRRTLETCRLIFQGHQSSPLIKVEPVFREIMQSLTDITTLSQIEESMQLYSYDFSQLKDKQAWFVHTLSPKDKEEILAHIKGLSGPERNKKAMERVTALQKENWSERLSKPAEEKQIKKRILPNRQHQIQLLNEYSKKFKNIAVVTHGACLTQLLGEKVSNCQILLRKINEL